MLLIHSRPIVKKHPKNHTKKDGSAGPENLDRTKRSLKGYFPVLLRRKRISDKEAPLFSPEKAFRALTQRIKEEDE